MAKKRVNSSEIDESFLISTISGNSDSPNFKQQNPEEKSVEPQVKKERKQRSKPQDYELLFIQKSDFKARTGKVVYIRPEYHERVSKIVSVIGNSKISIFDYIDHVLAHHFETFKDEITRIYNEKNSNIF